MINFHMNYVELPRGNMSQLHVCSPANYPQSRPVKTLWQFCRLVTGDIRISLLARIGKCSGRQTHVLIIMSEGEKHQCSSHIPFPSISIGDMPSPWLLLSPQFGGGIGCHCDPGWKIIFPIFAHDIPWYRRTMVSPYRHYSTIFLSDFMLNHLSLGLTA